ncbi:MAG: phosphoglycolate phosphatase [Betaproteobacteria bacterium]|nr:phosphoglycolate phosphatase [Betaproteobacteria bacterium]
MHTLPRFIMFDLDGTLVDTASEIAEAVNRTLGEAGLPALPVEQIRNWIGKGTAWLFGNALTTATEGREGPKSLLFEQLYPRFIQHYAAVNGEYSAPYPGAQAVLKDLRQAGCRLGVVTNKERSLTLQLLERHALNTQFDVVVAGGDTPQGKPSPLPLQLALKRAGVEQQEALFVGDSSNDVQASRNAGVAVWAFNHGYNHGEPIAAAGPDAVLDSFEDLETRLGVTRARAVTV